MCTSRVTALGAALLLLVGCASVTRGTTEAVQFDSEPSGAEMRSVIDHPCGGPCPSRDDRPESGAAYVDDSVRTPPIIGPACITPCTLQIKRSEELIVTFTKPGYEPETVKLRNKLAGAGAAGVAGNLIIGGVAGMVVDSGTGAALDHYPNPLKVVLRPISPAGRRKTP